MTLKIGWKLVESWLKIGMLIYFINIHMCGVLRVNKYLFQVHLFLHSSFYGAKKDGRMSVRTVRSPTITAFRRKAASVPSVLTFSNCHWWLRMTPGLFVNFNRLLVTKLWPVDVDSISRQLAARDCWWPNCDQLMLIVSVVNLLKEIVGDQTVTSWCW